MQLVRKLLSLSRSHAGRNQKIRGLSTAELVGIIVIIGILGALGGTYIGSLVTTANTNTGNANAQSLNSVCASMLAAGVSITGSTGAYTIAQASGGSLGPLTDAQLIADLNNGITDPTNTGVIYRLTPQVTLTAGATTASGSGGTYTSTATTDGNGNVTAISWAYAPASSSSGSGSGSGSGTGG